MVASVTHAFTNPKSDSGDATVTRPSDWNAAHVVTGLPGEELDYVEKTTNTSITATTEAAANTVVTANAVAFNGSTTVMIEFFSPSIATQATSSVFVTCWLYDGSSSIGLIGRVRTTAAVAGAWALTGKRRLTPSNATHTYSIRAMTTSGTSTVEGGAGGTAANMPAFIRITRV
jgi:hypothetical protein